MNMRLENGCEPSHWSWCCRRAWHGGPGGGGGGHGGRGGGRGGGGGMTEAAAEPGGGGGGGYHAPSFSTPRQSFNAPQQSFNAPRQRPAADAARSDSAIVAAECRDHLSAITPGSRPGIGQRSGIANTPNWDNRLNAGNRRASTIVRILGTGPRRKPCEHRQQHQHQPNEQPRPADA